MSENDKEVEAREPSAEELLVHKLQDDINYFSMEWDMNYAQMIGCLNIVLHELLNDVSNYNELDEDEDKEYNF